MKYKKNDKVWTVNSSYEYEVEILEANEGTGIYRVRQKERTFIRGLELLFDTKEEATAAIIQAKK